MPPTGPPPVTLVLDVLQRRLGAAAGLLGVWLFGSQARGAGRPDSDVDLAVLVRRPLPPEAVFEAAQDLALALRRDVDLVDLSRAPGVLRAQVVAGGRCLHAADPAAVAAFEMYALSDHARLAFERREAVAAFEERYRGR